MSSYDRLTGSVRWERSLSNVAGQTYPLAIELVTDDVNDRILLIGSKSDGGFGSDVVTRLEAFSSTGITLFENALQTDRFGFGGELLVGEDGALFALQRCQLQRWSDYEREEAAPEAISGFCGDVDPDGFTRANYLGRGEIFVTGALTDGSNFDTDLVVLKAGNQDAEWVFTDGLPGQQDADFATSSAPVPDEGGFYLLASTALPDARYQARLLKTDQLGEVIWQRDFPPSEGAFGYGRGMLVLADQGVMIQYSDGRQSHLAIVEPDGTLRWDKATTEDYVSNQFRDINLVQLIDGSVVTHRNIRINDRSELSLNRYSLAGELLDEWIITGFTHRDPLTGMKLTKAGQLLLMGRPSTELSTVQIWQFDPNTESVDWKWETGSFNTEAKEVNDAVELPNGNILAAVELQTYGPGEEVTHQLRLVEIDENGSEVRVATHPTAAANILQHLEMTLTEDGKIMVLTAGGVQNPEVAVYRYDRADLSEELNVSLPLEDAVGMWLAGTAYLGRGYVQFYGETYAEAERQGEQLFLTVFSFEELATSTSNVEEYAGLSVYPNPVSGLLWLATKSKPLTQRVRAGVYSSTGQLVREVVFTNLGATPRSIDLSGLPTGVYALRLNGGLQATRRVVVR